MSQSKKIVIFYTDAGGGHRATALALQDILNQKTPYETTLCNPYRELIGDIDLFPRFSGFSNEEVYNHFVVRQGWPGWLCLIYYGLTLLNVRLGTRESVKRFLTYWQKEAPDLVISVMPLANHGIYQSVRTYTGKQPVPFLVVITDLEEKKRHVWFPPEQDYYIVCGSERAYRQALCKPHPEAFTFHTSGPVINPSFYEKTVNDCALERLKLGLKPNWTTGCMMYGTAGTLRMVRLARALQEVKGKCQMIFLCGRNTALADELRQLGLPYPHLIRTYTHRVPYYFSLSDFLVCKPGPGTLSEAGVSGLTLLADRQNVLPQERYNIEWLRETGAGLSFRGPNNFRKVVQKLLDADGAGAHRSLHCATSQNRAIFEIPGIVRTILEGP